MRNRFDRQLVQLNDELIEMGGMIEKAIADTVKAKIIDKIGTINRYSQFLLDVAMPNF